MLTVLDRLVLACLLVCAVPRFSPTLPGRSAWARLSREPT
jgi:hypothetical protein